MKKLLSTLVAAIFLAISVNNVAADPVHNNLTEEQRCLALTIYYEARGEPIEGQYAIADVVLNRVSDPDFPKSVCEVTYQDGQFHWTDKKVRAPHGYAWLQSQVIAKTIMERDIQRGITNGAVYFQRSSKTPKYAKKRTATIGAHSFFI